MQLMPATAERFGVFDSFNAKANINGGVRYLRWLLNTFAENADLAVAAYNAGEGNVSKYNGVPPFRETMRAMLALACAARKNTTSGTTFLIWTDNRQPGTDNRLCPRMILVVHLLQSGPRHVRVNLRGRDIRMAKHQLDGSEVRAVLQKMRRERMPEDMRGDV